MANRLARETSPYLLQHAHNPVDWYPWGEEALRKASVENKPILLSIGYSACHWCHVMERESFESEEVARLMNESFVSIKVDREEHPEVDSIYMTAVQMMTGQGGWPLTVFLTPDGRPFYGGTYYPPEDRHGMPGFPRVLRAVSEAYRTQRGDILRAAQQLTTRLRDSAPTQTMEPLTAEMLNAATRKLGGHFDPQYGGFGSAPKFPQPMVLEFLLRSHHRTGNPQPLQMVELTLTRMAMGGIYDQLRGGFHRYSTDPFWLVPHFEKMLYDNALLSRLYLHAYQATGKPLYRRVTEETLDYVLAEMTGPDGGFYSTQDADSEGEEGRYYLWTSSEVLETLGKEDGQVVNRYFGITPEGNFEGRTILHVPQEPEAVAQELGMSVKELATVVERGRRRLLEARGRRVAPGRDDKLLTAWNGLMLRSLAEAAAVLGREDYRRVASASASFLTTTLRQDGRLLRTFKDGQAKLKGCLEDYALLIDGLLALYEATFHRQWLDEARGLADAMLDLFWDDGAKLFYDTGRDHDPLVVRPRDTYDNALPCGQSAAADVLLRLAVLAGADSYSRRATASLRSMGKLVAEHPLGFGHWLCALDFYLSTPKELAIVGPLQDEATLALLQVAQRPFLPNKVVVAWDPADGQAAAQGIPFLESRGMVDGRPTAYVCQHYACQAPVTEPHALAEQLGARPGR
ncbi:MAG: thioredoxin domain-containing protein [Chloroflexi bacterium]|nr:thioredoxin domain-containing protein [Chloroflexota bacterium]